MKGKFVILIAFALLVLGFTNISAQERITFKRGAKQAVVTGYLKNYRGKKVFVIRVRRGQTLRTEQLNRNSTGGPVTVAIKAPNGEYVGDSDASCNNRKEISPTVAGDYRIIVVECMKADPWRGNFRLKIRVE